MILLHAMESALAPCLLHMVIAMNTTSFPVTVCRGGGPQGCVRFHGPRPGGDGGFAHLLPHASEGNGEAAQRVWSKRDNEDTRPRELDQGGLGAHLSNGQGVDLGHTGPQEDLAAPDSLSLDRAPTHVLAAVCSGQQIPAPVAAEPVKDVERALSWTPLLPLGGNLCEEAVSLQAQRDEGIKETPFLGFPLEPLTGPQAGEPGHGEGPRSGPAVAVFCTPMEDPPARPSVEGGDGAVASLDMGKELTTGDGPRRWEAEVEVMRGQAGPGKGHNGPIALPGQGVESHEGTYTLPPLGTTGGAGSVSHDEAMDIASPQAPHVARGALGTSAAGSHGHLVNLVVEPPNLGPLRVKIHVRGGDVRALFLADGAVQKAALETGLWDLRQRLVHQGLSVQELAVHVGAHGGDGWQGYLSREGGWASQGATGGVVTAPEEQVSSTGAVTVGGLLGGGGTLDLRI